MSLKDSPSQGVLVVGWESRDHKYHTVYDIDRRKVGRSPTDRQMERALRVVIRDPETGEYHTISKVTPRLDLDKVIVKIRDHYKELEKRR